MTRRLTLPHGLAGLQPDGTLLVVMSGEPCPSPHSCPPLTRQMCRYGGVHLPADLLAAAAPCEACGGKRFGSAPSAGYKWSAGKLVPFAVGGQVFTTIYCPDCRIELVGECPTCGGISTVPVVRRDGGYDERPCPRTYGCDGTGTVTLGYAYAVGEVQGFCDFAVIAANGDIDPCDDPGVVQFILKLAVTPCSAAT